ncbi:phosphonate metabolism transcriptional regulator PhnF [Ferrovibrio sp.]|uniref:phosphonate metabolism transcriptional regulator PhnF n=1 Tax=Ferrovibrio sp. TaxID=1917215 RepID=UPI0035B3102B
MGTDSGGIIERGPGIERGNGMAIWRQVASRLEREIRAGEIGPGERLPTEKLLSERFGVNRHTVRQAMARLGQLGLIRIEQGRGMFVADNMLDYALGPRTRFTENLQTKQKTALRELISAERVKAPAEIARALGLPLGAELWQLETLNRADGKRISVSQHYFPAERFPNMPELFRRHGTITAALAAGGVADYRRRSTRVSARLLNAAEARLLQLPRSRATLQSETVNIDPQGRPIEFVRAAFAADHVVLSIEHTD